MHKTFLFISFFVMSCFTAVGQSGKWQAAVDKQADKLEPKVIEWRRHFHQNPELSNREFKTAEKVAAHLKAGA
jgi:hypothetical protein